MYLNDVNSCFSWNCFFFQKLLSFQKIMSRLQNFFPYFFWGSNDAHFNIPKLDLLSYIFINFFVILEKGIHFCIQILCPFEMSGTKC